MKLKSKKSALLLSFTSLLLCFAMLAGSTFAWFTDTATTGVNQIKSGNLDIEVQYRTTAGGKWEKIDDQTDLFGTASALFEPGHTRVVELKIENAGNLALKYKIGMNIASETVGTNKAGNPYKLSDYLKVAATGFQQYPAEGGIAEAMEWAIFQPGMESMWKEHPFTNFELEYASNGNVHVLQPGAAQILGIKVYMPDSVGNEANAKTTADAASIKFGLSVYATQYTTESDSFGTQYDKDATYPETFTTVTAADYQTALEAVKTAVADGSKNVTISVRNNISGATGIVTGKNNDVTVDLGNKTVEVLTTVGSSGTETLGAQFLQGSSVTLKNGTYKFTANNRNAKILIQNYSDLTLDSVTLDADGKLYALSSNCGKVTIKGATNITASSGTALDVMHWENDSYKEEGTSVTFDETMTGTVDGKIDVYCYRNGKVVQPVDDGGAMLTIMGGTFKNSGLSLEEFKKFVPAGYSVTENNDGSFTVGK